MTQPPMALGELLAGHGIGLCVLFGSQARGAGTPASDLDLGVLRGDGRSLTYAELGALVLALQDAGLSSVDLVDLSTPDVILRFEVARDGVVWFVDAPERWADFVGRALIDHDDLAPFLEACVAGVGRAALSGGA